MKNLKIVFSIVLLSLVFMLNGCGGGSGGGTGSGPSPTPSGAVPVFTAFSINGSAGVITGNNIALILPFGTSVTALAAKFTAPGLIVTVNSIPQISGVSINNFTQPVVYTITRIGTNTSSAKVSASNTTTYTVTVTVASISAKSITAFSLGAAASTSVTPGIISILNIAVTVPLGTNVAALVATYTTSGQSVTVNGVKQVNGTTQNDFTKPVTYTVTAADGTTQNYIVTVTVASATSDDIIAFSLNGTPGVISQGGLAQTIVVKMPFGTNVNGLVTAFITAGASVVVNGVTQVSGTTQNDFTNPVTYIVTSANGTVQTYIVTVIVSSSSSKFINDFSFGTISGVITGQSIAVTVPFGTDLTALIPTFTTTGVNVTVNGVDQTNTQTPDNFSIPVVYTVIAADGTSQSYTVTVTVAHGSAKAITAFSFGTIDGVIINQNIAVTVPFGTDVTSLIASFSTTGVSVSIGTVNPVTQISGTTANNFTNPVSYIVTASDGSTETYIVTVTVSSSSSKAITAFSIAGITGTFTGFNINITLPFGSSTTNVATFTTTGAIVSVNGVIQFSGTTTNDFTSPVTYVVTAADGSTQNYIVTVTVALNSAKAITAFALNGNVGVITNFAIAVSVPFGTNVTALTATFTTTGVSVNVGGVKQNSAGAPTNNFTSPVVYTVVAADGTTQNYTVTVTVGPSSAKSITAFTLPSNASSTITGQNISVVMPTGTNLTNPLVATFTVSAGASVSIGATPQISGSTSNVFSSPIVYTVTAADTTTATYTVTVTTVTYAYVSNSAASGSISMYSLTESTGLLTPLSTPSISTDSQPWIIAFNPLKTYLYSSNRGSNTIGQYSVNNSTGILSLVSNTANGTGTQPISVVFNQSGQFLYVLNFGNNTISMYSVDGVTGALTPIFTPIATDNFPIFMLISPSGNFLYVSTGGNLTDIYSINNSTGQLISQGSQSSASSGQAAGIGISPSGNNIYTAIALANRVNRQSLNSSTGVIGGISTFAATGSSPQRITFAPSGNYLYVSNRTTGSISMFSFTDSTGVLLSLGSVSSGGVQPDTIAFSPSGTYAYVTNSGSNTIASYSFDSSSGVLTTILAPVSTGSTPTNIVFKN